MKTAKEILHYHLEILWRSDWEITKYNGKTREEVELIAMKEYAEAAMEEDRKNVAGHAKVDAVEEYTSFTGVYIAWYVNKDSIINAPKLELK